MRSRRPFAVYLRDHELGAHGGVRAFERAARSHRSRPWGADLAQLAAQVREDLRTERRILRSARVRRHRIAPIGVAIGERLGRLKGNGAVLRRSPTTDLVELEALLTMVRAKRTGWRALQVAEAIDGIDIEALVRRADAQERRLVLAHEQAAARSIGRR